MRVSKNFTLQELTRSNVGLRLGIKNEPTTDGVHKLTMMVNSLVQPIRDKIGPIRITSGYRSPAINAAIGGSPNSQHCRYEAIDCQYVRKSRMDNRKIYDALVDLDLDFDQCILEFGTPSNPAWIHLSWKVCDNRRQVLVAYKDDDNKTKYKELKEYKSL